MAKTSNNQKITECGQQRWKVKTLLLQRCALRKFHVPDGQNTRDQITSDGRSKRAFYAFHSLESFRSEFTANL